MPRQVYLENWQERLVATIDDVEETTIVCSDFPEQDALLRELAQLREMARQVRDISPAEREMVESVVIALSVREHLQLSNDLVERLGELFDIYRRFRTRLSWSS